MCVCVSCVYVCACVVQKISLNGKNNFTMRYPIWKTMDTSIDEFDKALMALSEDVASALQMEQMLSGKPSNSKTNNSTRARQQELNLMDAKPRRPVEILQDVLKVCIKKRKLENEEDKPTPSDEQLSFMARFTDKFKLVAYRNFLHFVPRLVNVVTVNARLAVFSTCARVVGCLRLS